ncbi:MAG: AAA family ATPase, partial [bacterium]
MLINRCLTTLLAKRLSARPVVVLTGARQTGKTTLAHDLLPARIQQPVEYINLDDPDERLRLTSDPVRHLDRPGSVLVLDEVHKLPVL